MTERKKNFTRTEIQKAAKKVFFRKGYSNTSIEEVARVAKISKGSIYVYFKNKDDLYVSLMLPVLDQLGKRLLSFQTELTGTKFKNCQEVLVGLLNVFYEAYKSDPDEYQIIQIFQQGGLISDLSEETRCQLNARGRENFGVLRQILRVPRIRPHFVKRLRKYQGLGIFVKLPSIAIPLAYPNRSFA